MNGTTEGSAKEMFTEEKIRFMFDKVYLQNNKQTKERNEHGIYVIPEIEAAWCGFKGAFEYLCKPGFGYYAFKHPDNEQSEWCVCYIQDFEEDGFLSQERAHLNLPDFEELEANELVFDGEGSGRDELIELGFIILDDPIWDFDPRFKSNLN